MVFILSTPPDVKVTLSVSPPPPFPLLLLLPPPNHLPLLPLKRRKEEKTIPTVGLSGCRRGRKSLPVASSECVDSTSTSQIGYDRRGRRGRERVSGTRSSCRWTMCVGDRGSLLEGEEEGGQGREEGESMWRGRRKRGEGEERRRRRRREGRVRRKEVGKEEEEEDKRRRRRQMNRIPLYLPRPLFFLPPRLPSPSSSPTIPLSLPPPPPLSPPPLSPSPALPPLPSPSPLVSAPLPTTGVSPSLASPTYLLGRWT